MASKNHYISQFLISGNDIVNASVTFADLGTVYTDNVTEGTSLYYSNARVANAFVGTGTANALLYLNASKVATSGNALTFDGTTLTSSVGSSAANYIFNSSANTPYIRFDQSNSAKFFIGESSIVGGGGSGNYDFYATSGLGIRFFANATEGMRLTSTGLTTQKDATIYGLTVGRGAGAVATNTALGVSALAANTTGSSNTAVGNTALYSNITGATNTAFGSRAGYFATSSDNTLVGNDAGRMITTGANNTALGSYVMNNSAGVTGSENVGIGRAVLTALTSGSYNIAVGSQSLYNNTTASNNTAVGYQAGFSNTTGGANTFIGRLAGYNNTTAGENTAIGNSALYWNTTGTYNVAIGTSALSTGAGSAGSNGDYNVAVGVSSLNANRASSNTALGYASGGSVTTGGGNTLIGNNAGAQLTTGTYNTYIGGGIVGSTGGAGFDVVNASKQTIIGRFSGNQGGLDIRGTNNYIVLSDGDGNPRLAINGTEWLLAAGGTSTTGDVISNGGGNTSGYNGILIGANMRAITTQANTGLPSWLVDIGGRAADGTTYQITTADKFRVVRVAAGGSFYGTQAAFEVNSNGCVGLNTSAASTGTGITFPATQLASSNANTLDDYEEGTWTPTVGGNAVMGIQAGDYIKIGKLVWINFDFSVVTLGTGSNRLITGLPFPFNGGQSARTAGSVNYFVNLASTASAYYLQVDGNGIYLDLNNAASSNITDGPVWIQSGTRIMGTIMYQTSN